MEKNDSSVIKITPPADQYILRNEAAVGSIKSRIQFAQKQAENWTEMACKVAERGRRRKIFLWDGTS